VEDREPDQRHAPGPPALVQFQVLGRVGLAYDGSWEPTQNTDPTGVRNQPVTVGDKGTRFLESTELGWKDTVRANPHEMLTVMAQFTGHAGRFMYHCHVLEHEDMDMMRPFVVTPARLRMSAMGSMSASASATGSGSASMQAMGTQ